MNDHTKAINALNDLLEHLPPFTVRWEQADPCNGVDASGWCVTASAPAWHGSGPRYATAFGVPLLEVMGEAARGALAIHEARLCRT